METPRTSIVILTRNELEYTKRCLESIARWTPEPYELVLVDNGSDDGTVEYLRSQPGAVVIENGENLGFGGGCNQGIAAARGQRILLLNNDTMATPGWLDAMHGALDADSSRGLVGPRSNHVGGDQKVEEVDYDVWSTEGLEVFARDWTVARAEQGKAIARLIGFCILMRREVVEQIGGFDLRYGIGNFEDDDFCLRAAVAGFTNWMCDDSFVHHFGSRTFAGQGVSYERHLAGAWEHFSAKWRPRAVTNEEGAILGYEASDLISGTRFDAAVHYSPLVAVPDKGSVARFERRSTAVLLLADRLHPQETAEALAHTLRAVDAGAPVTVVVRIDPADSTTLPALETIADELGDRLPDVVVLEASDRNDEPAVRACDIVLAPESRRLVTGGMARWCGVRSCAPGDLADCLRQPA